MEAVETKLKYKNFDEVKKAFEDSGIYSTLVLENKEITGVNNIEWTDKHISGINATRYDHSSFDYQNIVVSEIINIKSATIELLREIHEFLTKEEKEYQNLVDKTALKRNRVFCILKTKMDAKSKPKEK